MHHVQILYHEQCIDKFDAARRHDRIGRKEEHRGLIVTHMYRSASG